MAQFEGQSLHVVRLQGIVIIDNVVVGGTNSPPVSSLADQVEVIPAEEQGRVERRSHKTRLN
jgi:predicted O-methyltransferase YrrM